MDRAGLSGDRAYSGSSSPQNRFRGGIFTWIHDGLTLPTSWKEDDMAASRRSRVPSRWQPFTSARHVLRGARGRCPGATRASRLERFSRVVLAELIAAFRRGPNR